MKFFHKYIVWFYSIAFAIGILTYALGYYLLSGVLTIISLVTMGLGLLIFSYSNWRNVFLIYFRFIYRSPKQKYEDRQMSLIDSEYAQNLKLERKYNRKFYLKNFLKSIMFGILSLLIIALIIISITGEI